MKLAIHNVLLSHVFEVYVLLSRVTDPRHLALIGMPPADLLEAVCAAWEKAGLDVVECLRRATQVTNEWVYTATDGDLRSRFTPRRIKETTVPVVRSLAFLNCMLLCFTCLLCLTVAPLRSTKNSGRSSGPKTRP